MGLGQGAAEGPSGRRPSGSVFAAAQPPQSQSSMSSLPPARLPVGRLWCLNCCGWVRCHSLHRPLTQVGEGKQIRPERTVPYAMGLGITTATIEERAIQ